MRMANPIPQFSYFVKELKSRHPDLAYIHVVEPRVHGPETIQDKDIDARESNDFLREIWGARPYISAGAYTRELALQTAQEKGDLIAFGRYYISNVSDCVSEMLPRALTLTTARPPAPLEGQYPLDAIQPCHVLSGRGCESNWIH